VVKPIVWHYFKYNCKLFNSNRTKL